jgi:hypothetical protein
MYRAACSYSVAENLMLLIQLDKPAAAQHVHNQTQMAYHQHTPVASPQQTRQTRQDYCVPAAIPRAETPGLLRRTLLVSSSFLGSAQVTVNGRPPSLQQQRMHKQYTVNRS